ncbi:MAG: hypothetical protein PHI85_10355 [Victivallaceae bacterium]|nr:hypothetical protein [Victivallaceae bacterium]
MKCSKNGQSAKTSLMDKVGVVAVFFRRGREVRMDLFRRIPS